MLSTRQLTHFLAIVDNGSLGRAAKVLYITEPALSKSVRALENTLQVKIFDRGPRGLVLTVFGESLLAHSRAIVAEIRKAQTDINELRGADSGRVYVGTGPSFAISLLPEAITRLLALKPRLKVTVIEAYSDTLLPKVLQGELDFMMTMVDPEFLDPDLTTEVLAHDQAIIVANSRHPLGSKLDVTTEDLQQQHWVLPQRPDSIRMHADEIFTSVGLHPPQNVVEVVSSNFGRALIGASNMLSFLPRFMVTGELERKEFIQIKHKSAVWERSIGVVYRRLGSQSPACRALLNELRAVCAEFEPQSAPPKKTDMRAPLMIARHRRRKESGSRRK